jgi:hypothetical protein
MNGPDCSHAGTDIIRLLNPETLFASALADKLRLVRLLRGAESLVAHGSVELCRMKTSAAGGSGPGLNF